MKDWDKIERFSAEKRGVRLRIHVSGELEGEYLGVNLHRKAIAFESVSGNSESGPLRKIIYRLAPPDTLLVIVERLSEGDGSGDTQTDTTRFRRSLK